MSQKKEAKEAAKPDVESANKWRDLAEEAEAVSEDDVVTASQQEEAAVIDEVSKDQLTEITNALEKEVDKHKHDALLAKAEMENVRRRLERDVSNARKFGSERLIVELLPVIDSLVRGIEESSSDDAAVKSLRDGMEMTLDMLHKTLEKNGVSEISPEKGAAFDPSLHEAMAMQPAPDAESNTILQVMQRGYSLNGRVVRAAMVMVAS